MPRDIGTLCLLVIGLLGTGSNALATGTAPTDELVVSHPRQLALIAKIDSGVTAEEYPPGVSLRRVYDRAAKRLQGSGITPYSIREYGCEPMADRQAWFKEPCDVFLEVGIRLRREGIFVVTLRFHRNLQFTSGDKPYYVNAVTWLTDGEGRHEGYAPPVLDAVDRLMNVFLAVYLQANRREFEAVGNAKPDQ